jgi:hypothetical protein
MLAKHHHDAVGRTRALYACPCGHARVWAWASCSASPTARHARQLRDPGLQRGARGPALFRTSARYCCSARGSIGSRPAPLDRQTAAHAEQSLFACGTHHPREPGRTRDVNVRAPAEENNRTSWVDTVRNARAGCQPLSELANRELAEGSVFRFYQCPTARAPRAGLPSLQLVSCSSGQPSSAQLRVAGHAVPAGSVCVLRARALLARSVPPTHARTPEPTMTTARVVETSWASPRPAWPALSWPRPAEGATLRRAVAGQLSVAP